MDAYFALDREFVHTSSVRLASRSYCVSSLRSRKTQATANDVFCQVLVEC